MNTYKHSQFNAGWWSCLCSVAASHIFHTEGAPALLKSIMRKAGVTRLEAEYVLQNDKIVMGNTGIQKAIECYIEDLKKDRTMTQEEIIRQGPPIEPQCFETDREEQWYKVGLYEGATATLWRSAADGCLPPVNTDCLFVYGTTIDKGYMREDKTICIDAKFAPLLDVAEIAYWMEIPQLPKKDN